MKRLFTLCAIVVAVVVSSCSKFDDTDIWDKLNDHESRITALEELCKQLNTNINALQTIVEALEKKDYVTNVSPVREDGEIVGYTISFANSDTITIYNGKDGKDGYTPQIGVMKDTDGIYYWTIDGEWLLDGKGNKIQANGIDGTNGDNGITPRLKIEDDYWYVSYDDGTVWEILCKAVGEDGIDGDNMFTSITQDDEYVYFNLADGTMITLPKHDMENIQFEDIRVWSICCLNWDTNNDNQLSYKEAAIVTSIEDVFKGNKEIVAFDELKYFTSLTTIPNSAFECCTSLCKISLPQNITAISNYAFYSCSSLYSIEIPENVTHIGENAFYGCCNLKNIKLPSSLLSIDKNAFVSAHPHKNVYITDLSSWCNIDISSSNPLSGGNLYLKGELVTDLVIPNDVIHISAYAFYECHSINSIHLGENVEVIEEYAFSQCDNLTSIEFNNRLTSLERGAFYGCSSIDEINIPDNVILTNVGEHAFCDCDNLKEVILGDGVQHIGASAFSYCENLYVVRIGKGVALIEYRAFKSCPQLFRVYCEAITPPSILYDPTISNDYWSAFSTESGTLKIYVPYENISTYKNSRGWNSYKNYIYEYDFENNVAM